MKCKIYLPSDWMYGDATAFYVDIIADALKSKGYEVDKIKNIDDISSEDVVVTVTSGDVCDVRKKNPYKIINWFQGIAPEEAFFFSQKNKGIYKRLRSYLSFSKADFYGLRYSDINFFVSDKMRTFYRQKYGYRKNNYFIMPCFNQKMNAEGFVDEKYRNPSFVYAGSMDGWQCFEKTVQTFVVISKQISNASLTVLTNGKEYAKQVLDKYSVKAEIKYVPYTEVDRELQKYKYGFIIRDNNIVNNVATPTKMNSYLANGIIPIYTNVVDSFSRNLGILKYAVPLTTNGNGLDKLYRIEQDDITSSEVKKDFLQVFDKYYSREWYINQIVESGLLDF